MMGAMWTAQVAAQYMTDSARQIEDYKQQAREDMRNRIAERRVYLQLRAQARINKELNESRPHSPQATQA